MLKKYVKRPIIIEAERLTEEAYVETSEGMTKGNSGDWLVHETGSELCFCKDEVFKKTYTPVGREEEGFNDPFFFANVDMETAYGELSLPSPNKETVERILAFVIKGIARSLITCEVPFGDVYQIVHTAVNYGLTEAYQEAYNEEKEHDSDN